MANDMQWPSEDEDFDAKTDGVNTTSFNNEPEKLVAKPVKKPLNKVSVAITEPNAHQTEEAEPEGNPEIEQAFSQPIQFRDQAERITETQNQDSQEAEAPRKNNEALESTPDAKTEEQTAHKYEPAPAVASMPKKDKTATIRAVLEAVLVIALLAVGIYAIILQSDKKDLSAKNAALSSKVTTLEFNPQIAIQKQTDELIAKVGALTQLPKGETPTIANVSDASKAKQQSSFFSNAQNGDKVLMYVKAGEAILYRPSTNKIVLVAPLTFNANTTAKPTTTTPTTTPTR